MSSPQVVATSVLYDYLSDTSGAAIVGVKVQCTLNYSAGATVSSPAVSIGPVQQATTTDSNGYWQFTLVSNTNINPANTTYTIQTPYVAYDVTVGTAGPYQSTAVGTIVNTPTALAPATTNLTGPITVTGNETVTGALTVQGASTLQGGATVQNGETLTGGLTITDAASRIIPGATSFSVRNNANSADNLLVSNAGALTVRNTMSVSAGNLSVFGSGDVILSGGRLVFTAASAKITGGATQLSLRNSADTADNVIVADAGGVTLRNALNIPPSVGGTLAPTSYGTVPLKFDEKTPSLVTTVSFTLPSGFTHVQFRGQVRSDTAANFTDVYAQFNADTGSNYLSQQFYGNNNTTTSSQQVATTANPIIARVTAANATANTGSTFTVDIHNYNGSVFIKEAFGFSQSWEAVAAASEWFLLRSFRWNVTTALTSVLFGLTAGNYVSGSKIGGYVWP